MFDQQYSTVSLRIRSYLLVVAKKSGRESKINESGGIKRCYKKDVHVFHRCGLKQHEQVVVGSLAQQYGRVVFTTH